MSESVIGLDIGSDSIKAVQVRRRGDLHTPERFAAVQISRGTVQDGRVRPDAAGYISQQIRDLVAGWEARKVIFGLNSSSSVFMTDALLPPVDVPEDLDKILPFYMETELQQTPGTFENAATPVGETIVNRQRHTRTIIYSVLTEYAKETAKVVEAAGLEIIGGDLSALGSLRACRLNDRPSNELSALVNIGADTVTVLLHSAGVPKALSINPDVAGSYLTNRIADQLGLDIEGNEAEWAKRNNQGDNPAVHAASGSYISDFVTRLSGIFSEAVTAAPEFTRVGDVTLTGGGSLLPGIGLAVRDTLGVDVTYGEYDFTLLEDAGIERYHQGFGTDYLAAVGLGMGEN